MKKLYMVLIVACFIIMFMVGMTIGMLRFSRVKYLGKQELQDYIDEKTNEYITFFEDEGFKVYQSHIIGILWAECKELKGFFLMAKYVSTSDIIYLHWKIDFLRQPVFFILINETAITYEPF